MDKLKFADALDWIATGRDKISPATASKMMADRIRKFLFRRLVLHSQRRSLTSRGAAGLFRLRLVHSRNGRLWNDRLWLFIRKQRTHHGYVASQSFLVPWKPLP